MTTETDSSERAKPDVSAVSAAYRRWVVRLYSEDWPRDETAVLYDAAEQAAIAACEAWAQQKLDGCICSAVPGLDYGVPYACERHGYLLRERDAAQQDADALAEALRELKEAAWNYGMNAPARKAEAALAAHEARQEAK